MKCMPAGSFMRASRIGLALLPGLFGPTLVHAQTQVPDPFTPAARWSYYLHRTYSAERLSLLAADTAIDHAFRDPSCWDSTAGSYGLRYTRTLERRIIRNTAELAAGLWTGEDLRYRTSRSGRFQSRIWNAVRASALAHMPDGTERPAYTRFFASTVADVSTAHWTGEPLRPTFMLQCLGWSVLDQIPTNLLDEFGPDVRRFGRRLYSRIRHTR